jgi:molybdopterin synthase sulfur carrier subunit
VLIKYFATFRELTRENSRVLDEAPVNVAELLELLSVRYGTPFRKAVFEDGELSSVMILLVNGRNVRITGGLATPVSPTDEVSVFPMVAGG